MLLVLPRKQTLAEANGHTNPKQINAYDKFMAGYDTQQVAKLYSVREPTALRWISQERSRRHGKASPYEGRQ